MPVDPPIGFNPLLAQHQANVELRGFEHSGEQAMMLEREQAAVEMRHDACPGGGVRVERIEDPALVRAELEKLDAEEFDPVPASRPIPRLAGDRGW